MNIFSACSKPDSARLLFLGYPGKTAFLYFRKLGEAVATIPTIGFNVETFESPSGFKFTGWDIGGCDKIRPLVKHYYDGTDAIIFFIGTTKKAEVDFALEVAKDFILWHDLPEVPTVFFCVQRDLPAEEVLPELEVLELLSPLHGIVRNRPWALLFGSTVSNLGHDKVFQWLERQLSDASKPKSSKPLQKVLKDSSSEPSIMKDLQQSIPVSDSDHLDDTSFLEAVENYTLPSWDHKTHLRLAFLVLTKEGRQRAVSRIMELIKNFIDNSARTSRGKTFHITMTYFWIQMVHYALATLPKHEENASPLFEYLLLKNPWLLGSGLYRFYYSDEVMLKDPASRVVFIPPDKKPLPNVL